LEAWLGLGVKVGNGDNSHIGSNGSEKGLEAIVGGAVREVTSEYLRPVVSSKVYDETSAASSSVSGTAASTSRCPRATSKTVDTHLVSRLLDGDGRSGAVLDRGSDGGGRFGGHYARRRRRAEMNRDSWSSRTVTMNGVELRTSLGKKFLCRQTNPFIYPSSAQGVLSL